MITVTLSALCTRKFAFRIFVRRFSSATSDNLKPRVLLLCFFRSESAQSRRLNTAGNSAIGV